MIYLYCHKNASCFISYLKNIQWLLDKNNIKSIITHQIEQNDHLWIVICDPNIICLPRKCIIYNMDPMIDSIFNSLKTISYK